MGYATVTEGELERHDDVEGSEAGPGPDSQVVPGLLGKAADPAAWDLPALRRVTDLDRRSWRIGGWPDSGFVV